LGRKPLEAAPLWPVWSICEHGGAKEPGPHYKTTASSDACGERFLVSRQITRSSMLISVMATTISVKVVVVYH
jgi:hypothetical protein